MIQNILKKNIEEYDFRGTLIDMFWKLQFLNHFIFWNEVNFDNFYSTERKTQKLFKWLVVGRMCNIVR